MRNVFRYIILSVLIFTSASLNAEEKPRNDADSFNKNRISFAYGFASAPQFMFTMDSILRAIINSLFSTIEEETYTSFGPVALTYDRNMSKHLSFGVVFAYENYTRERILTDSETEREDYDLFTLMPRLTLRWGWQVVSFYHGISFGAGLWLTETEDSSGETESDNYVTPALHFYLVGINLNIGDTVSLFGDFGVGFFGTINIGLALNF